LSVLIMFLIYSLLFSLGVILTAPYYLWRLRGNVVSGGCWRERFGFLPSQFQQPPGDTDTGALWIHAVSVGETLAVAPLVQELQKRYPGRRIFLSHVTPAGRQASESRLPDVTGRFYLPLDWRWSVERVLARLRPALLLIVETELWPNLLYAAHASGTRVVLVNARLSDRSFRGYRLARPFMRRVFECVDWIGVQSSLDAERYRFLGAKSDRVIVTGNVKFDGKPPKAGEVVRQLEKAIRSAGRGPVLVAASTMPGEDALLLSAWQEIRRQYSKALLILAPRHPARFDEVARLLASRGQTFVRRTALAPTDPACAEQLSSCEILLLDSIGELAGVFALADLVLMGGSMVPTGGHNLLEPAFWSKPILFGPHMENFRDVSALLLEGKAAVQVHNASELAAAACDLLSDPKRARLLGKAAKEILVRESGATERILERLRPWLEESMPVSSAPRLAGSPTR
jgi:3-deoxy-D-manno-octulosonic-acid transferase